MDATIIARTPDSFSVQHAAEYLGKAAALLFRGHPHTRESWLDDACHRLKHKPDGAEFQSRPDHGRLPARSYIDLRSDPGGTMEVYDLDGRVDLDCDKDLIHRLRSARRGKYGAIILRHDGRDNNQPSLYIHINGDLAYLHYFPDNQGQHPGFQAKGMMAGDCEEDVRFLMTSGMSLDARPRSSRNIPIAHLAEVSPGVSNS
jgi:hypothetical protein